MQLIETIVMLNTVTEGDPVRNTKLFFDPCCEVNAPDVASAVKKFPLDLASHLSPARLDWYTPFAIFTLAYYTSRANVK